MPDGSRRGGRRPGCVEDRAIKVAAHDYVVSALGAEQRNDVGQLHCCYTTL